MGDITTRTNRPFRDHGDVISHNDDDEELITTKVVKTQELTHPIFPVGRHSYVAINSEPGSFYVDKTSYIPTLESLGEAVVLLAPRRFGKSLFLDTLACYYDISRKEKFEEDFGKRWIGQMDEIEHNGNKMTRRRKTPLANKFYVLRLDFSNISQANTFETFNKSLNALINNAITSFCWTYPEARIPPIDGEANFSVNDNDATMSFSVLFDRYLILKNMPLMILIDEYDNFLNSVIGNKEFARDPEELKKMEFTFKAFFSNIKSRLGLNMRVFIAGVTPMVLSMYTSGFNVGLYHLQDEDCANLFGFTERDVEDGLKLLRLAPDAHQQIYALSKELHNGYRFCVNSNDTLFNPTSVQFVLSKLGRLLRRGTLATIDDLKGTLFECEDPNTMPAEPVLAMVSSNPHTFNIVTDCINNPDGFLTNYTALTYQFRASTMAQVDQQSYHAILSWMFFNGALTFAAPTPRISTPRKISFKVPNLIARQEYIDEFFKSGTLDAHSQLQKALWSLLDEAYPSIDPFLRQIEASVLASAQGRDVKDQEQAFHKVLLTCLTLCKRPSDTEYLVKPWASSSKDGDAVDLVYHAASGTQTKKRYVFELKNIPVQYWKERQPIGNTWSQLAEASSAVIGKSDADLRKLMWKPVDKDNYITVQTTIDDASKQLEDYLMEMKKKDSVEGPSIGFVIVRVGLYRLVSQRVQLN